MAGELSSEEHGGINPRELAMLGISADKLLDFSVNSNPFGPSPGVIKALQSVDISHYPDRECHELRDMLAEANGVHPSQILPGNGTAELIWLIAQALLQPDDVVLIAGPTFGEYARAAMAMRAHPVEIRALPPRFDIPISRIVQAISDHKPRLVFLCHPNNPTGQCLSNSDLAAVIEACGSGTLLALDEAYRAFAGAGFFGGLPDERCLLLRSMTKDFALAGLRLGYLLASTPLIEQVRRFQPPWSVNGLAQAAGSAALSDIAYYEETLAKLKLLQAEFFSQLAERKLTVIPSRTHFSILTTGQPARIVRECLLNRHVQVRDCASFGLPEYVRVSTQQQAANSRFLNALDEVLCEMHI